MKVANNKKTNKRIEIYLGRELLENNIFEGIIGPIENGEMEHINDIESIKKKIPETKEILSELKVQCDGEKMLIMQMLLDLLESKTSQETKDKEDPNERYPVHPFILSEMVSLAKFVDEDIVKSNEFSKIIDAATPDDDNLYIKKRTIKKDKLFELDTPGVYHFGSIILPKLGYSNCEMTYYQLRHKDEDIAEFSPVEINSLKTPIRRAKGKVLVLGAGIGYLPYELSNKDDVESIVVVENNANILKFFNNTILPNIKNKEKIKTIEFDFEEYLKSINDGDFDYCYIFLEDKDDTGELFIKLKEICSKFENIRTDFWNEAGIMSALMSYVCMVLFNEYAKNTGKEKFFEELFALSYFEEVLKNKKIKRPDDVDDLMSYNNILYLMERHAKQS